MSNVEILDPYEKVSEELMWWNDSSVNVVRMMLEDRMKRIECFCYDIDWETILRTYVICILVI